MARPPYDPMLEPLVEASKDFLPEDLDLEDMRIMCSVSGPEDVIGSFPSMSLTEYYAPGFENGDPNVTLAVFKTRNSTKTNRPAVYSVHGGGQVAGNRFLAATTLLGYFEGIDIVYISVEYRLAPEHRAPAALHDTYAGLLWTVDHAAELGIDPGRILMLSGSGGAPIAVGTAMLCRDNDKPFPLAQMVLAPMLDDRDCTVSCQQFAHDGPWCGTTTRRAWDHVLGSERGGPNVSEYVAPARATNLAGLPPTFIDVGECEVLRDEAVAFASQLWKCGVSAELHVWPGAFHAFDMMSRDMPLAKAAREAKVNWIRRLFGSAEEE